MNITIIGATGMVGSRLVDEAITRGHHVTAGSRNPSTAQHDDAVSSVRVDTAAPSSVDAALISADVVILTIRAATGRERDFTDATTAVLDAAGRAGVPLLVVGGAGPLRTPEHPGALVIDDPACVPPEWRAIAGAGLTQMRVCAEHPNREWTYLSPPAILEPGVRTGSYRRGTTTLLTEPDGTSRISAEDLAVAILDEAEHPGPDAHFTVARSATSVV